MAGVAQTNLQLLAQLRTAGMGDAQLRAVHQAYMLAAQQTAGSLRGSGKPFVCHLVGTASLAAQAGCDAAGVCAALLHALYQHRVAGGDLRARRLQITQRFGEQCEQLVYAYHCAEHAAEPVPLPEDRARDLQILQLADMLEDALDGGLLMHGAAGDDATRRGSARWRVARMANGAADFLAAAQALGVPQFAALYQQCLQQAQAAIDDWPLHTGQMSTFVAEAERGA